MFSQPHLRLLSILAIVVAITQATWFNAGLQRRQDTSNDGGLLGGIVSAVTDGFSVSSGAEGSSTTSAPPSSTSTPPSSTPSSTPASTTPSSTPSSSTLFSSSITSTPQSTSTPPSSTNQDSTSPTKSEDITSTTEVPSSSFFMSVVVLTTVVDGSTRVSQSTYTSATSKPTGEASLNNGSAPKSPGMSDKTKKTVIGVVVGIGGAVILAGLGIVAYRIWGRKKNEDESDGLMGFRIGSAGHEKSSSLSSPGAAPANPFQTTLDQYHNPNRHVNASSNF